MSKRRSRQGRTRRGRRGTAAMLVFAALTAALPGSAAGAANTDSAVSWPMLAEIASPSGQREVAERQAAGCALLGLGVTGLAMASGALTAAGTGGTAAVPVGVVLGEVVAYFGAGCTIGAFLATLPLFGHAPADGGGGTGRPGAAVRTVPSPRIDREQVVTGAQPAMVQ